MRHRHKACLRFIEALPVRQAENDAVRSCRARLRPGGGGDAALRGGGRVGYLVGMFALLTGFVFRLSI